MIQAHLKVGIQTRAKKNHHSRSHLNTDESGRMAKAANVKNLVLTHFTKNIIATKTIEKALKENYSGNIIFGYDLLQLPLQ